MAAHAIFRNQRPGRMTDLDGNAKANRDACQTPWDMTRMAIRLRGDASMARSHDKFG